MRRLPAFLRLPIAAILALAMTVMALPVSSAMAATVPSEVQGVSPANLDMNLFDYWVDGTATAPLRNGQDYSNTKDAVAGTKDGHTPWPGKDALNQGINKGHTLKFTKGNGGGGNASSAAPTCTSNPNQGSVAGRSNIVKNTLNNNGYPVLNCGSNQSLGYLFNPTTQVDYRKAYPDVTGLFQVNDKGYYYYDSASNYAALSDKGKSFILYSQPAIAARETSSATRPGQFFPFNPAQYAFNISGEVPKSDMVTDEGKQWVASDAPKINHYFGMTMTTDFLQPVDGKVPQQGGKSEDMTFTFSGDDDMWIFIDGVLVADLGGVKSRTGVTIDFSTGKVKYDNANYDSANGTTIKKAFQNAGKYKAADFENDTFADLTTHTMKCFYLERGNWDSNLRIGYNLVEPTAVQAQSTLKCYEADGTAVQNCSNATYKGKNYFTAGPLGATYTLTPDADTKQWLEQRPDGGSTKLRDAFRTLAADQTLSSAPSGSNSWSTVLRDKNGKSVEDYFSPLYFSLTDVGTTLQWTLSKTGGDNPYIAYQPSHTITVAVQRQNGVPVPVVSIDNQAVSDEAVQAVSDEAVASFENRFQPATLTVRKEVESTQEGTDGQGQFHFTTTVENVPTWVSALPATNDAACEGTNGTQTCTAAIGKGGTFTIDGLPGGASYKVQEATPMPDDYEQVDGSAQGQVPARDWKVQPESNAYSFTAKNRYVTPEQVNVSATKTTTGHAMTNGQFTFTLTPTDDASKQKLGETTFTSVDAAAGEAQPIVTADGKTLAAVFSAVDFRLADVGKTYTWTLQENQDEKPGYTLDRTPHTIAVTISRDGNGPLVATTSIDGGEGIPSGTEAKIGFTNAYEATGWLDFSTTKQLNGDTFKGGDFTFLLKDKDGNVLKDADGNDLQATNDVNGKIVFPRITYTKTQLDRDLASGLATMNDDGAYHYVYTVSERTVDQDGTSVLPDGVTSVQDNFSFAVNVKDNNDGTLDVSTADREDADGPALVNQYRAQDIDVYIDGVKYLTADPSDLEVPDIEGQYTFTLKDADGNELATATNQGGNVRLGPIHYTKEMLDGGTTKEFTYSVEETGSVPDVVNDPENVKEVTVTLRLVNIEGTDTLVADVSEVSSGANFAFTNVYHPDIQPTSFAPQVRKVLEGRDLAEGEFGFELLDAADGSVVSNAVNAADGTVTFPEIAYDQVGTYVYNVREVPGDLPGVSYDTAMQTIEVQVTRDAGSLQLQAHATYGTDLPVFTNTYTPTPTSVTFQARKILTGRDLKDGEFSFELRDQDGKVLQTKHNDKAGNVTFDAIDYRTAGEYGYTVNEVKGDDPTITYDGSVVKLHVKVTDDVSNAMLTAEATADTESGGIVFTNAYQAPAKPDQDPGVSHPIADTGVHYNLAHVMVTALAIAVIGAALLLAMQHRRD